MRIYLDVCCLNRPYDDLSIGRNRLEAEAVLEILRRVGAGEWELVGGEAVDAEIGLSPSPDRRAKATALAALRSTAVTVGAAHLARAAEFGRWGLKAMDALHLACAEEATCDVLLTTDDQFRKACEPHRHDIMVRVANPLAWIAEVNPL